MLVAKTICDTLTDQEIVRKSLEEIDYFSCLYERYAARLLRYIKRLVQVDPEEAGDILQESFIKVWTHLNAYDPRYPLSGWLYRIVHNQAISFYRKSRAYGRKPNLEWDENALNLLASDPDFEEMYLQEKNEKRILELLAALDLRYREVLVMRYLENLSYEEISDVLRIPEGTVATRINRAKKALLKSFEKK